MLDNRDGIGDEFHTNWSGYATEFKSARQPIDNEVQFYRFGGRPYVPYTPLAGSGGDNKEEEKKEEPQKQYNENNWEPMKIYDPRTGKMRILNTLQEYLDYRLQNKLDQQGVNDMINKLLEGIRYKIEDGKLVETGEDKVEAGKLLYDPYFNTNPIWNQRRERYDQYIPNIITYDDYSHEIDKKIKYLRRENKNIKEQIKAGGLQRQEINRMVRENQRRIEALEKENIDLKRNQQQFVTKEDLRSYNIFLRHRFGYSERLLEEMTTILNDMRPVVSRIPEFEKLLGQYGNDINNVYGTIGKMNEEIEKSYKTMNARDRMYNAGLNALSNAIYVSKNEQRIMQTLINGIIAGINEMRVNQPDLYKSEINNINNFLNRLNLRIDQSNERIKVLEDENKTYASDFDYLEKNFPQIDRKMSQEVFKQETDQVTFNKWKLISDITKLMGNRFYINENQVAQYIRSISDPAMRAGAKRRFDAKFGAIASNIRKYNEGRMRDMSPVINLIADIQEEVGRGNELANAAFNVLGGINPSRGDGGSGTASVLVPVATRVRDVKLERPSFVNDPTIIKKLNKLYEKFPRVVKQFARNRPLEYGPNRHFFEQLQKRVDVAKSIFVDHDYTIPINSVGVGNFIDSFTDFINKLNNNTYNLNDLLQSSNVLDKDIDKMKIEYDTNRDIDQQLIYNKAIQLNDTTPERLDNAFRNVITRRYIDEYYSADKRLLSNNQMQGIVANVVGGDVESIEKKTRNASKGNKKYDVKFMRVDVDKSLLKGNVVEELKPGKYHVKLGKKFPVEPYDFTDAQIASLVQEQIANERLEEDRRKLLEYTDTRTVSHKTVDGSPYDPSQSSSIESIKEIKKRKKKFN
ncbi:hypothetical protein, conserved [Entamoeba dispar SAW760]|uniref:Uncharacterized protein n=1 Tax=Entamoeba dispar (strain ATCC PRA-260 / SAW760) TaxID=370354 RepID=B0EC09_ENTDS|nr:uncharacterized protein EDI_294390 [Entamoeba dispar SAW760]EDR27938.1 hypothetical protein, conserved [Entamoeba dispar SAW760]|eukprot:EDR27938.1 hypothetical protein, conserved [Entamoeba dispar SAW760]